MQVQNLAISGSACQILVLLVTPGTFSVISSYYPFVEKVEPIKVRVNWLARQAFEVNGSAP